VESTKKRQDCKKSKSVVITRDPLLPHDTRSLMREDWLHIQRKGGRTHAYVRI
jgi:hypothetical protein